MRIAGIILLTVTISMAGSICAGNITTSSNRYELALWTADWPIVYGTSTTHSVTCGNATTWQTLCPKCDNGKDKTLYVVYKENDVISCYTLDWAQGGGYVFATVQVSRCGKMEWAPDTICAQNGDMWALGVNSKDNDTAFTQISTGYGTCASIGYKNWGGRDPTAKVDTLKNPKDWNQCTNPQGVLSQGTDANGRAMYTCGSWRCTGSFGASCFVSNATTQAVTSCECDGGCSTIDWSTCQGKFAPGSSASSSGSSSPSSSASSSQRT